MLYHWIIQLSQGADPQTFSVAEIVKYVISLLIAAGVAWIVKTLPKLTKDVSAMKQLLMGAEDDRLDNGLVGKVGENASRLRKVEDWMIGMEERKSVIKEIESELGEGFKRRLRDILEDERKQ